MELHFPFLFFFMVLRKSPIRWSKKQLKLYVCSIKTRVAIHFPKRFFFSFFSAKDWVGVERVKVLHGPTISHSYTVLYVP